MPNGSNIIRGNRLYELGASPGTSQSSHRITESHRNAPKCTEAQQIFTTFPVRKMDLTHYEK